MGNSKKVRLDMVGSGFMAGIYTEVAEHADVVVLIVMVTITTFSASVSRHRLSCPCDGTVVR